MKRWNATLAGTLLRLFAVTSIAWIGASAQAQTCSRPAAALLSPANGAIGVAAEVTYSWSPVADASRYELWASFDKGAFEIIASTTETSAVDYAGPGTAVEWYVVTYFADCSKESDHFTFSTAACPTTPATLTAPPNGSTALSPVKFSWTEPPSASSYRVWISRDGAEFDVLDETDIPTSTARLQPGHYDWFVETFYDQCDSVDSAVSSFTIDRSASCSGAQATPISPAAGASVNSDVHFEWKAVSGAIGYQLWASLDDGDFGIIDETTTGTTSDATLGSGHVDWYVVAQFSGCDDVPSAISEFEVIYDPACDHESPLLVSPAEGDQDVPLTVDFLWTGVADAKGYKVWASYNGGDLHVIATSTVPRARASVNPGEVSWFVETTFDGCPSDASPASNFTSSAQAACTPPVAPDVYADSESMSGQEYELIWSPGLNTASYQVQEATAATFAGAQTIAVETIELKLRHDVTVATRYYYRVRSLSSCGLGPGPWSSDVSLVILPGTTTAENANAAGAFGSDSLIVQKIHLPGSTPPLRFTATIDKPWLRVTPASGTIGTDGIDLIISADPKGLPPGSSSGTLLLNTFSQPTAQKSGPHGLDNGTATTIPVSVNLVTKVTPNAGNSPIPQSLFIPTVVHSSDAGGRRFESNLRIANTTAQTMRYLLSFTPTRSDGTKVGQQSTIQIEPGVTAALDDVLKNFFGYAGASDTASGVLEIRPLVSGGGAPPSGTFASARSIASTTAGTFGAFVPAIPFSSFVGQSAGGIPSILSLQNIAESSQFSTDLGLIEASGSAASVLVSVVGKNGQRLGSFPIDLKPAEHIEIASFLAWKGVALDDGRLEVSVTSAGGRVSAYATVRDKATNDPILVSPVNTSIRAASRQVLAGIADLTTPVTRWKSDVRLFNAGTSAAAVNVTFYSQDRAEAEKSATLTLAGGQVRFLDSAELRSLLGVDNKGGSLVIEAPPSANVVATARTFNDGSGGSYSQFIPAATAENAAVAGGRALQLLQLEESPRFRTNLGIVEVSGNPAVVEISVTTADSKLAVKTQVALRPNEFKQFRRILQAFGLPITYNARIALKVLSGAGRVAGYVSVIDEKTQDATYVPAQ